MVTTSANSLSWTTSVIQQASSNLQQVFSTASGIADQALFLTDLVAFFDMKPTVVSKPDGLPAPRPIRSGFEFRNVSFAYPGTSRAVLKGFQLQRCGLGGARGADRERTGKGRSTVVKLITRLYDPTEGQILLDGKDSFAITCLKIFIVRSASSFRNLLMRI